MHERKLISRNLTKFCTHGLVELVLERLCSNNGKIINMCGQSSQKRRCAFGIFPTVEAVIKLTVMAGLLLQELAQTQLPCNWCIVQAIDRFQTPQTVQWNFPWLHMKLLINRSQVAPSVPGWNQDNCTNWCFNALLEQDLTNPIKCEAFKKSSRYIP